MILRLRSRSTLILKSGLLTVGLWSLILNNRRPLDPTALQAIHHTHEQKIERWLQDQKESLGSSRLESQLQSAFVLWLKNFDRSPFLAEAMQLNFYDTKGLLIFSFTREKRGTFWIKRLFNSPSLPCMLRYPMIFSSPESNDFIHLGQLEVWLELSEPLLPRVGKMIFSFFVIASGLLMMEHFGWSRKREEQQQGEEPLMEAWASEMNSAKRDRSLKLLKHTRRLMQRSEESHASYIKRLQGLCRAQDLKLKNLYEFLAYVSHEIRTPLNSIFGFSEYLTAAISSPSLLEFIDIIRMAGKNLLLLTSDLLDFSHIQTGNLKIETKVFSPRKVCEEVVYFLSPMAHIKKLRLTLDFPSLSPDFLMGDPLRIQQILFNLISNAIKFTHQGEVVCRIRFETGEEGEKSVIFKGFVNDTGPGIPKSKQHHLFKNFSRLENVKGGLSSTPGFGFGLAICKKLVDSMKGAFGIESDLNKGASFWFKIPVGLSGKRVKAPPQCLTFPSCQPFYLIDAHESFYRRCVTLLAHEKIECLPLSHQELMQNELQPTPWPIAFFIDPTAPMRISELETKIQAVHDRWPEREVMLFSPLGLPGYDHERLEHLKIFSLIHVPLSHRRLVQALTQPRKRYDSEREITEVSTDHSASRTVLVVDDQPYNLRLLEAFLKKLGQSALLFHRAEEAIRYLQAHQIDLIFMDIQMPDMDGMEALTQIKALNLSCRPMVVALTARVEAAHLSELRDHGFDAVFTKPIGLETLQSILENHDRERSLQKSEDPWSKEMVQFDLLPLLKKFSGEERLVEEFLSHAIQQSEVLTQSLSAKSRSKKSQRLHARQLHDLSGLAAYLCYPEWANHLHALSNEKNLIGDLNPSYDSRRKLQMDLQHWSAHLNQMLLLLRRKEGITDLDSSKE